MISGLQDVYDHAIPAADQPGDRALSVAHRLWGKRSVGFAPLISATAYSDMDSPWPLAPKEITGSDQLYQPGSPMQ